MLQTVESIILNIEFEGVLYVFEYTEDQKKMYEHKKLIKWLMSEDAMRLCSLILLCLSKESENGGSENIKS